MDATSPRLALLSVVVPCYNEAAVLNELHARLQAALGSIPDLDYELIYVDDGSNDATFDRLRGFAHRSSKVRVVRLARNFGHQVALTVGLEECVGDAAVLIDADLQDPPTVIAEMVVRWRAGVDVAYGVRLARAGENRSKLWLAGLYYWLLSLASDRPVPKDAGEFRLMDRKVIDALLAMPERDRLTRALVSWIGFRQEAVCYNREPRFAGKTKFPPTKMLRLAMDGLLSFSLLPLRIATWLGFLAAFLAFGGICYAATVRLLTDTWVTGWAALFTAILFVGGIQLIVVGILGEYVGRIYGEVKRRPLYFVAQRLGFPERANPAPSAGARGGAQTAPPQAGAKVPPP